MLLLIEIGFDFNLISSFRKNCKLDWRTFDEPPK